MLNEFSWCFNFFIASIIISGFLFPFFFFFFPRSIMNLHSLRARQLKDEWKRNADEIIIKTFTKKIKKRKKLITKMKKRKFDFHSFIIAVVRDFFSLSKFSAIFIKFSSSVLSTPLRNPEKFYGKDFLPIHANKLKTFFLFSFFFLHFLNVRSFKFPCRVKKFSFLFFSHQKTTKKWKL